MMERGTRGCSRVLMPVEPEIWPPTYRQIDISEDEIHADQADNQTHEVRSSSARANIQLIDRV